MKANILQAAREHNKRHPLTMPAIAATLLLLVVIVAMIVNSSVSVEREERRVAQILEDESEGRVVTLNAILDGQFETLKVFGAALAASPPQSNEELEKQLAVATENSRFIRILFTDAQGVSRSGTGDIVNISGRNYFKKTMSGENSVERVEQGIAVEGPWFILSVPIKSGGSVVGSIQGIYSESGLRELISSQAYGGEAYSTIIAENGDYMIGSDSPAFLISAGNTFVALEDASFSDGVTVDTLKTDLAKDEIGTFKYELDGNRRYVVYMPLGVEDSNGQSWYLINSLPAEVAEREMWEDIKINSAFYLVILFCALAALIFLVYRERRSIRIIEAERESLRISEEQFRIASSMSSSGVARYDIKTRVYQTDSQELRDLGFADRVGNVPWSFLDNGVIAPGCEQDFLDFVQSMETGEKISRAELAIRVKGGEFHWFDAAATTIFDADGKPDKAIISFSDISEQREKEVIYKKWQQSIEELPHDEYTLIRCNLNKTSEFDSMEGSLLNIEFSGESLTFNERTDEYADQYVYEDDRQAYVTLVNSENLLAAYHRGERAYKMDYREMTGGGEFRWLRVTIDLVEYPNSTDIEAYMMYENVDSKKREELLAKHKAETDPLTGVLNRNSFKAEVDRLLSVATPETRHAMLMMDIDEFKSINDNLGHEAGDKTLVDIATALRSIMRKGDLVGRMGGDEFFVCLRDIPYDAITEKKAKQICSLVRRTVSENVKVSASVGIATFPKDGTDFDTLYRNADTALYYVKQTGKDYFAFYSVDMAAASGSDVDYSRVDRYEAAEDGLPESRRRLLVVDDNEMVRQLLTRMLKDDYFVETAPDGRTALVRMKHLGTSLSAVLLDLSMPGMDGFEVLNRMQQSLELRSIPVIVVSGSDDRETSLKAIKHGATDYVTKPIDPELIGIRVEAAITKAENERTRAQSSYLILQGDEETKYRTVLESTGTVVIEYDWLNGVFSYDPLIHRHIAGYYDTRTLWRIFLSDMVAGALDVKEMQQMVHDIASDRERKNGTMIVKLKTQSMKWHYFRMGVFKIANEFGLTDKLIITFNDVNEEVLADEMLRFQAERDDLTGLYNRRTFLEKSLEWVRSKPENFYVMTVMDVDNFKLVNDRLGHAEGDKMLKFLADRLMRDADRTGSLCGRLGSDVFAALAPYSEDFGAFADNYSRQVLSEYPTGLELTYSVGCCLIDDTTMPMETILDRAEMAKMTVKGKVDAITAWYDQKMEERIQFEQDVAAEMENALATGQYQVYFQPQYNHVTGRLTGAEALVRWIHPEKGIISPGDFIPIFEKNGFITRLDEYVWNHTAEYIHEWIEAGLDPVPVSVNVSRVDTSDPKLCDRLVEILERHNVPKELFRIEITESAFVEKSERIIETVNRLHEKGILVEMDDFGSGYSSLNILKDVPVDVLKLDMRFLSGEENQERGGTIINAVMRMARWLSMPVIAEGVETMMQADFLTSIGCQIIQGFLYAKPMPAEDFRQLLAEGVSATELQSGDIDFFPDSFALWNAESEDSRMFTEYMDAAVIYELHDGVVEALRANKRFIELLQFDKDVELPTRGLTAMHEDDVPKFIAAVEKAAAEMKEQKVVIRRVFGDGREPLKLRCTLRIMAVTADRIVFMCLIDDTVD